MNNKLLPLGESWVRRFDDAERARNRGLPAPPAREIVEAMAKGMDELFAQAVHLTERTINPPVAVLSPDAGATLLGEMNARLRGRVTELEEAASQQVAEISELKLTELSLRRAGDSPIKERDAARENHLKVMRERDTAVLLLAKFQASHRDMQLHDEESCDLCREADALSMKLSVSK